MSVIVAKGSEQTGSALYAELVLGNPAGNQDVMYFTGTNPVPDFVVDNTGDLVYVLRTI